MKTTHCLFLHYLSSLLVHRGPSNSEWTWRTVKILVWVAQCVILVYLVLLCFLVLVILGFSCSLVSYCLWF